MNNKYLPESGYKRVAVISLYVIIAAAVLYIALKYLIGLFLPFIIAWVIASLLQPPIRYLCRRFRISLKAVSIVVVLVVFAAAGVLLFIISDRLIWEAGRLVSWLSENADIITGEVSVLLEKLTERIPISFGEEHIASAAAEVIDGALLSITSRVPEMVSAAAGILPRSLFFTIMLIAACFYICAGYQEIGAYIERRLPRDITPIFGRARSQAANAGRRYLRAYAVMFTVTFAELLVGLLMFKIDYAFMMALLIAAVDILPVLGTGTILIPWSIVLLATGDYYTGFGMLIIYGVVTVVRQIMEPRIVGVSIGLHPLITLMAMYAGFRLFGFTGIILLPIAAILAINIFRDEKITAIKEKRKSEESNESNAETL